MSEAVWPRPVPLVGDPTSAAERGAEPEGWAFGASTVAGLDAVMAARRDVRRYRPDPVAPDVLRRVLAAGHQAPSVGHSQPWRFVVVRAQQTRDRAAVLADRERLRQAELFTADRRARLLDLQLEGIREAPVGVVVACDRRAPAAGVLGRASFGDADMWSCACAIENMWLAARSVGLGLGWVTLFQPSDLARLLGLPDGVETLGWLCLGWPDERPPDPGLERQGWSQRLPLDDVVIEERWPADGSPPAPVSHLASAGSGAGGSGAGGSAGGSGAGGGSGLRLAGPAPHDVVAGRDMGDDLLAVPGSLGVLDVAVNRILALGPAPSGGTLLLAAGDHPVTAYGVSAFPTSVTADVFEATRAGVSLGASTAAQAGLAVEAVHAVSTRPAGDLVTSDAMDPADVADLLSAGAVVGGRLAGSGLVCLGEVGIGNTTVAAALACALLDVDPAEAVGLGAGADAAMVDRKLDVVTKALARARASHYDLGSPEVALAALGGPEVAFLAGVTLGAAASRAPVVLDGLVTSLAALVAVRLEPAAQSALVAGQQSRERVHGRVLAELGLEPVLQLRLRAGEGVGACLAAQILLTALRARARTARVERR